jgi:hypothetical protein
LDIGTPDPPQPRGLISALCAGHIQDLVMSEILSCLGLLRFDVCLLRLLEETAALGSRQATLHRNAYPSVLNKQNRIRLPKPEFNGAEIADVYSGDVYSGDVGNFRTADLAAAVCAP